MKWFFLLIILVMAFPAMAQETELIEQCRALMTGDGGQIGDGAPTARITSPVDGETIYGDRVTVTIGAENFELGEGKHWHIWVDDTLRGMVYEPATVLDLAPGTYRICAALGDAEHMDLGNPDGMMITVAQAAEGTPTSPAPVVNASAPIPEEGAGIPPLVIIVAIALAGIGGWWMGRQLGARRGR